MTQLTQIKGIGKSTTDKLATLGITSLADLNTISPLDLLTKSGIGSTKIINLYKKKGYNFSKTELDQINRSTINSKVKISQTQPKPLSTQQSPLKIPNDLITVKSRVDYFRPYGIDQFEVSNIKIYNSSGIKYETNSGWFEDLKNKFRKDIKEIQISQPVKRNKENLTRNENFYIKTHKGYYVDEWDKKKITLYIHESEASLKLLEKQVLEYKTDKKDVRSDIYELNVNGQKFNVTMNTTYTTTSFGHQIDAQMKEFKDLQIKITEYELTNIMKHYKLVKR